MTFDERGLVAIVVTWHPLLWLLAMGLAALLTWLACRMVRGVPVRLRALWVSMLYIGVTCALYGALTELFEITSVGVDWISLSSTVR